MKTHSKLAFGVVAVAMFMVTQAHAQTLSLVTDTFSYPDGVLTNVETGGLPWVGFSGTTPINVISGSASVTGANSQDAGIAFGGTHSSDQIFAAFDVSVTSWSASQGIGYFALFKDASTFNFFSRTYVTNIAGSVEFGISAQALGAGTLTQIWSSAVALGSTNRVTIGMDQTGATVMSSLYLNGTLVGSVSGTNASGYLIQQFALRQSNTASQGGVLVDNLDVYTIPEPSTVLMVGVGLLGLVALRRRK